MNFMYNLHKFTVHFYSSDCTSICVDDVHEITRFRFFVHKVRKKSGFDRKCV